MTKNPQNTPQPRVIEHIHQRFKSDCGVACVAMAAGVTYEQAFAAFNFDPQQKRFHTQQSQLADALNRLGFVMARKKFKAWDVIAGCAIVPVNQRCQETQGHWVVVDGTRILDPWPRKASEQHKPKRYRPGTHFWLVLPIDSSNSSAPT